MEPRRPIALVICGALIQCAAWLVPAPQRLDWKNEWQAEIWHRWQFLLHAQSWTKKEALLLIRRCLGALPDAFWHLTGQDVVQSRMREVLRSPWTCLGGLAGALLLLLACTLGLPATRNILVTGTDAGSARLVYIWFHPSVGGADEGLPPDVIPAWASRSKTLESIAPFVVSHQAVRTGRGQVTQPLVVRTNAALFRTLNAVPLFGKFPERSGVVLTNSLWRTLFHANPRAVGSKIQMGHDWHTVAAVLPPSFHFLSRQTAVYLVQPYVPDAQAMVVARIRPGITEKELDSELVHIAETACYDFFRSELRYSFVKQAAWIPLGVFAISALASGLLVLAVSRAPLRRLRTLLNATDRRAMVPRVAFFVSKVSLAFLLVFVAALEWSRSSSAILYGSHDPAAGPFLLWLYTLGTMGVLFWAVADQRARCRVCLRLLCFPVRVGCPGCLLLNWSGTELLCSEGHGMLHVPHLAPSWDEEVKRWISLDESWKDLFAETK